MKIQTVFSVALVAASSLLAAACGKSVLVGQDGTSLDARPPESVAICGPEDRVRWSFVQPQPTKNTSLDVLFVADSSESLNAERTRVADNLSAFVSELPLDTDYRVGVMLAHGASSSRGGRLYSSGGSIVLDSKTLSLSTIQSRLKTGLGRMVADTDDANGEAMLGSFLRSLEGARYQEIRSQGFYRDDAALTVIFVSDENDLCYRPDLHGYGAFPDFVKSAQNLEVHAYSSNCLAGDGSVKVSPEIAFDRLRRLKPDGRFSIGGVVHVDPAKVPRGGEDSIGHGILQLIGLASSGEAIEIEDSNYREGLARLGHESTLTLRLQTEFSLTKSLEPASIRVRVDQKDVEHAYDSSRGSATIGVKDAGGAGSLVEVEACPLRT